VGLPKTTRAAAYPEVGFQRMMMISGVDPADWDRSRLQVRWVANDGNETVLADTTEGMRVLETT